MNNQELVTKIVSLAEECKKDNPMAAGVLFHLAGSITAGPEWLGRTFDLCTNESRVFIQFVTGEGETRQ